MVHLNEEEVRALLNPRVLVEVLRRAFVGDIHSPQRTHHHIPGSDAAMMLLMPAWTPTAFGVKVLTLDSARTEAGFPSIDGLYLLMDGASGAPVATIEARALTIGRTAAVSALAASYLARRDASTLLMVGTGNLAQPVIEAHCTVRNYKRVILWGRDKKKAEAVRDRLRVEAEVEIATDLNRAIAVADVISCATSSTQPLVHKKHVRAGTHVDLIGGYTPKMRETDSELFRGARVIVDTMGAVVECGDLIKPCSAALLDPTTIHTLSELIRDSTRGRQTSSEITLFKAAGTAIADLAVAEFLVAASRQTPNL